VEASTGSAQACAESREPCAASREVPAESGRFPSDPGDLRASSADGSPEAARSFADPGGSVRRGPGYPARAVPSFLELVAIDHPIIQAPMAGTSTPALAAEVANTGALGSLGVAAMDAATALAAIAATRERSKRSVNVNVFCHRPPRADAALEAAWIERLRPEFTRFGAAPPPALRAIYTSFVEDDAMLAMLVAEKPKVVSFHFGVPGPDAIRALREAGIVLLGSATSLDEARRAVAAGVHAVVAQGYEAGGHRGVFDPDAPDDRLGTIALVRLLVRELAVPVVAAGGIMDGAVIAAVLRLGASAAQLGTAFVACPESQADAGYRAALMSDAARHTVMTRAISGRPARCLANGFTALVRDVPEGDVPAYPIAYDAGKALHAAAKAAGEYGFGAQWAGQGAPLARSLPAARLVAELVSEMA
jgi:nitronate monooxygenase